MKVALILSVLIVPSLQEREPKTETPPPPPVYALVRVTFHPLTNQENARPVHIRLLKRPQVLNPALTQVDAKNLALLQGIEDPAKWLEQKLELEWVKPDVLQIGLRGGQPKELARLIDAVSDAYIRLVIDADRRTREDTLKGQKEILKRTEQDIRDREKAGPMILPSYTREERERETERWWRDLDILREDVVRLQVEIDRRERAAANGIPKAEVIRRAGPASEPAKP